MVLAMLPWTALAAFPHAIGFECKVLEEIVRVEAYFSDDTPAIDAQVVVRNPQNEIIAQGRTDERGIWTSPDGGCKVAFFNDPDGNGLSLTQIL